ncbi:hypothetical protein MNBD_ACTINO02-796 [hydrothermal vent metagenome]|uniref:Uncharacterized protein n=1 Tax=hydrothermal vent metagenome TaxID=652676 RepID=A0A3B0SX76_9ZZZZ
MQPSAPLSTIMLFMDSTHTPTDSDAETTDRLEELASVDPADAPAVAERLAAELAGELDASSAQPMPTEQLKAEFDTSPE